MNDGSGGYPSDIYLVDACRAALDLSYSCFGPLGRLYWIGENENTGNCTDVSLKVIAAAIRGKREIAPLFCLLGEIVSAQTKIHGDLGHYAMIFSASLIQRALENRVPVKIFQLSITEALKWSTSFISMKNSLCCRRVNLNDLSSLLSLVKSSIGTKRALCLNDKERDIFARLLIEAFLSGLNLDQVQESSEYDERGHTLNVRYFAHLGRSVSDSRVLKDEIIIDMPLAPEIVYLVEKMFNTSKNPVKILLFDSSILLDGRESSSGLNIMAETEINNRWGVRDAQEKYLRPLGEAILTSGAHLVLSQRIIHPWLRRYLLENQVISIERLSLMNISALQALTGAKVINFVPSEEKLNIDISSLGYLDEVAFLSTAGGRSFLRLKGCKENIKIQSRQKICTLELRASDNFILEELQTVSDQIFKVLKRFVENPILTLGAGATEIAMSDYVKEIGSDWVKSCHDESKQRKMTLSIEIFCSSLKNLVIALQPRATRVGATSRFDVLNKISESNEESKLVTKRVSHGWDPLKSTVIPPDILSIVDSGPAKIGALKIAVEAANVMIRIKGVVYTK